MGTEIAISFNSLRTQLENERSSLFKLDENIKKIALTSGKFSNDRLHQPGHYTRGAQQTSGGRYSFVDSKNKIEDQLGKRKNETKTVFSRLSGKTQDSDGEDESLGTKRAKVSSAVSRELPTRAAVLKAQGDDEQARTRNRRIFGSLLGTLQKFKQEEIVLQTKEEKKAQVERKIEEQARLEKEREKKERKSLFAERENKKATIKTLEAKMGRVIEFERWEASQKNLANFILTKTRPRIYWLPKKMTDKALQKLEASRKFHEKCMLNKRQELQDELLRIERKCMGPHGPATKENDPENSHGAIEKMETNEVTVNNEEDKSSKRNKFAMDVDEKDGEDSDGDDRNDEVNPDEDNKQQTESVKDEEGEMVTNSDQEAQIEGVLDESTSKENVDNETNAENKEPNHQDNELNDKVNECKIPDVEMNESTDA